MANRQPYRVIELTQGYVAIISAADYRRVNKYSWHVHKSAGRGRKAGYPYARANIGGTRVYLHRFVMDTPKGQHCDHINHCTLDCRRENLQNVAPKENIKRRRTTKNV